VIESRRHICWRFCCAVIAMVSGDGTIVIAYIDVCSHVHQLAFCCEGSRHDAVSILGRF
jgi:hypothetical protein